MALDNLNALLIEQLQDIYYAERQLVKALPKMAKAAKTPELVTAFTDHLEQTKEHVARLDRVFETLGSTPKATKCPAMDGLIEEASEMIEQDGEDSVLDAGLIASAQRVEHYEIAAYGNVKTFAEALGMEDAVAILDETLNEEKEADELLSSIGMESVIPAALNANGGNTDEMEDEAGDEEDEGAVTSSKSKGSGKGRRSPAKK